MEISTQRKYEQVYSRLVMTLRDTHLTIGDRLPSERELCDRLSVNIATVRRAYRQLVQAGIVEKRIGSGTYLARSLDEETQHPLVNLVLCREVGFDVQKKLSMTFQSELENRGQSGRILYGESGNLNELLTSCCEFNQCCIICGGDPRDLKIVQAHPEYFVHLSSMVNAQGVPVVRGDDTEGIKLLMNHLHQLGHERIALFGSAPGNELEEFQAAAWASELGFYAPELRHRITVGKQEEIADAAYAATASLAHGPLDFTAMVCLQDEVALGAMAAMREAGVNTPEDLSVVSIGNTILTRYAAPALTCLDPDLSKHIAVSLELLEHNMTHPNQLDLFQLVKPELIIRASTSKRP